MCGLHNERVKGDVDSFSQYSSVSAAVCCSVLQCVAVCCIVLFSVYIELQGVSVTVCYSVLQCVAVCCSVLQCGVLGIQRNCSNKTLLWSPHTTKFVPIQTQIFRWQTYVWQFSHKCVTRRVMSHIYDLNRPYLTWLIYGHASHIFDASCMWHIKCDMWLSHIICDIWLESSMCDMARSYVRHDSSRCATWHVFSSLSSEVHGFFLPPQHIRTLGWVPHSYMRHDSFMCVTGISYAPQDSSIYATWLIYVCTSIIWGPFLADLMLPIHATWLIHMCDMTHS